MRDGPLVQRPTYLDAAPPAEALPALKTAACDACDNIRKVPGAGLIGATLLGVTAAYFAPKFFDFVLQRVRGPDDDESPEIDLEVEPR